MNITKHRRIALTALLLASMIVGTLLGSGVAFASDLYPTLSVGWNFIQGSQSDIGWSYDVDASEWMNSGKTRVDFDSIRYYNGYGDGYDPTFGDTWVYDGYGYDTTYYITFSGHSINGINRTLNPSPDFTMDQLSPSNDYVFVHQYINYAASTFSDYVLAWTNQ